MPRGDGQQEPSRATPSHPERHPWDVPCQGAAGRKEAAVTGKGGREGLWSQRGVLSCAPLTWPPHTRDPKGPMPRQSSLSPRACQHPARTEGHRCRGAEGLGGSARRAGPASHPWVGMPFPLHLGECGCQAWWEGAEVAPAGAQRPGPSCEGGSGHWSEAAHGLAASVGTPTEPSWTEPTTKGSLPLMPGLQDWD